MKQQISLEQLLELSIGQLAKVKKKLEADGLVFSNGEGMTWDEKQNICQYMTIGRIIEGLDMTLSGIDIEGNSVKIYAYEVKEDAELCDELWLEYKQLLKEDNAKTNKD